MDAGLKQRLVGAGVLIAVAVIFLPLFLDFKGDGIDQTEVVSTAIPAPPGDEPMQELSLIDEPVVAVETGIREVAPEPVADEPVEPPVTEDDGIPTLEPAPEIAAVTAPPPPAPVVTPPPAPPPSAPPPQAASGRYSVSFGSFSSRANADRLKAQLALSGIRTQIEAINNDSLYRVRADGYASRAAAETARLDAQSRIQGLATAVLENAGVPTAPRREVSAGNAAAWAVQIGVFSDGPRANQVADELKRKGYSAYVEPVPLPSGRSYRVRVGPELRRENADALLRRLKAAGQSSAQVVTHP